MDVPASFGIKDLFIHMIADMAKAVSERPGETKQQQMIRTRSPRT